MTLCVSAYNFLKEKSVEHYMHEPLHNQFYVHACFSSLNAGESLESSESEDEDQVQYERA